MLKYLNYKHQYKSKISIQKKNTKKIKSTKQNKKMVNDQMRL